VLALGTFVLSSGMHPEISAVALLAHRRCVLVECGPATLPHLAIRSRGEV
jgi:hypothetical protein